MPQSSAGDGGVVLDGYPTAPEGHGKTAATQLALFLYLGYNIAASAISVPAGRHGDRHHPAQVLAVGAALFAASYL